MILFKILLMILIYCVLPVIIILKIFAHFSTTHTEKKMKQRKEKLLSYLPIKTISELLKILETENKEAKEYYFKTYYITTELHFNDRCLIQGKDNWIVCYADARAFVDEHYFKTEQEACEFFFCYYFGLL
ncbi:MULTISPECIES: hypothetical protein [Fusobacterium]|uniref:hypothetical protein n=1 Tax=Fusobacterium TaxID=848 RepID=UPI0003FA9FAE|nr:MULTISPECIES: hypothetical protein [Fusobacterium]